MICDIPVVTEYKYLGIWVDNSLGDHRSGNSKWGPSLELENSKRRAAEGLKAVHSLRPILTDRHCPLALKVSLIRNVIVSLITYGAKWTGFRQTHAEPLQKVVNLAARWAIGVSAKSKTYDFLTLSYELGIPTMESDMASRRSRLQAKLLTSDPKLKLRTQIQFLTDDDNIPDVNRQLYSWPRSGKEWTRRLTPSGKLPTGGGIHFGLHNPHRTSDEAVLMSIEGVWGYWEPVWTLAELGHISELREWLAERGWTWKHRERTNISPAGLYFSPDLQSNADIIISKNYLRSWFGHKKANALERTDAFLHSSVRFVGVQPPFPLRPWAMRGHIYETHVRSNGFTSTYVTSLMDLGTGFTSEGIPISNENDRNTWRNPGSTTIRLDYLAEWSEVRRERLLAYDPGVGQAVFDTRTHLL